ncbi:hypothetical protein I551_1977 [Mycobacterium ulcerans str. Harvey]|uniref:Uncharacterized protein n=1 Tax=Mycobacterium ulcerans str. Harvey TaxID=1299332 RepID=A0ABN0R3P5_MYCUL|nr:hypothetical protein I551_1977 [Mycobacterium ulcerans str. Harvey]
MIPNCPVVTPAELFEQWFPASKLVRLGLCLSSISRGELDAGLAFHSPLNYRPQLPKHRRMIIAGLAIGWLHPITRNRFGNTGSLRAALVSRSHVLHVSQLDYLRRMTAFLATSCSTSGFGRRSAVQPGTRVNHTSRISRFSGASAYPSSARVEDSSMAASVAHGFPVAVSGWPTCCDGRLLIGAECARGGNRIIGSRPTARGDLDGHPGFQRRMRPDLGQCVGSAASTITRYAARYSESRAARPPGLAESVIGVGIQQRRQVLAATKLTSQPISRR